jgi:hypothetical protein
MLHGMHAAREALGVERGQDEALEDRRLVHNLHPKRRVQLRLLMLQQTLRPYLGLEPRRA